MPRAECFATLAMFFGHFVAYLSSPVQLSGDPAMKIFVWLLVLVLVVLHQDFWNWRDGSLVGGILPMGLAYHMALTAATAVVWFIATRCLWPADLEPEEPAP
jgi:hypothetical protein